MNIMADSCSLTPPLSPFKNTAADVNYQELQDVSQWVPPCFNCGETGTPFTVVSECESYMRSGELKNLLEGELCSNQINGLVSLYDMTFSSRTGVFTNLKQLFACTRKSYHLLKILSQDCASGFTSYTNRSAVDIRKDMTTFLFILKNSLQRIQAVTSKPLTSLSEPCHSDSHFCEPKHLQNIVSEVWKELKSLLLFVRRISDLPEYICTKATEIFSNSSCYHRVHFCFDLWWSSLEIMHIIHCICSSQNIELNEEMCNYTSQGSRSMFSQTALLVLWDLCFISMKNYKSFSSSSRVLNPFLCPCVHELWVLLITLLDRRDEHYREGSFWYHFDFITHTIANRSQDSSASLQLSLNSFSLQSNQLICDRPEEFCLWIISHVSPLYKYGVDGFQIDFSNIKSCYSIVRHLVESALSRQMKARHEKHLRTVLSFCGLPVKLWEPAGDILLPLTDFFLRHIDDSFSLPGFEIRQLSYLFKTSSAWVEYIHKVVLFENYSTSAENSFYLYLHVLGVQLKASGCGGNLWRQLKGRIYSRLTAKRLKELSEVGLQNCFSVLLVIASVGFSEVSSKIAELVAIIETPPNSKKKQAISWKTLFALMIIHQEKDDSFENEASKLVSYFNKACSSYNEVSGDSIKKVDVLNLIFVYLENVVSIFEKSVHLGSCEHLLIGSGFLSFLPACGVSELNSVLEIVLHLLTRFRNVKEHCQEREIISYQLQHSMIWDSFCLNILHFTMNRATVNAPPLKLADIAVAFTILASYFHENSSKSNTSYIELFMHFGIHRNSNSSLMCRYLCFILHESSLMKTIKMHITDLYVLILQSWLKCGISLPPPCIQMKELTRVMLNLEEFVLTFPYCKSLVSSDDHGYTMIKLFRAIDESYQNCLTLQEKTILRQKVHAYFQGLPEFVTHIIKGDASSIMLHHIYKVTSHVVEYCSPCLYIKYKSDCVFPLLLDTLILPHVTFPKDKELINVLAAPIKEYFPLFLHGLARLDYRNDPYIRRKFKDIITYYVSQYTFASAQLLEIASDAALQKSETMNRTLFYFIVDIVKENFLAKYVPGSPQGVGYCTEIFKQVPSDVRVELANNLLPCLLEQLLLRDDPAIPVLKELLKVLLTVFQIESKYRKNSSVQVLVPAIKKLIDKHLPWLSSRVFRWLEYVSEALPFLMSEIIPFVSKSVESIEVKRGVGSDLVLRNGLRNLVNKCHQCN